MQREFEAAFGRLITNATAFGLFQRDQDGFFSKYRLNSEERSRLSRMQQDITVLHDTFVGKRRRIIQRPLGRTFDLLDEYGQLLLSRYLDIHPPYSDYAVEHEMLVSFLFDALNTRDEFKNQSLAIDVLHMESHLFQSLRSIIPGEALENINEPPMKQIVRVSEHTKLRIRVGVLYREYAYNLTNILTQDATILRSLHPEPTSLIVYRRFGEASNTIMRVSAPVLAALDEFGKGQVVTNVAKTLSDKSNTPIAVISEKLIQLANSLCDQEILVSD